MAEYKQHYFFNQLQPEYLAGQDYRGGLYLRPNATGWMAEPTFSYDEIEKVADDLSSFGGRTVTASTMG